MDTSSFAETDSETRAASLINLAIGLSLQFEDTGDINDLDQCIENHRDSLKLRPEGHPFRAASLSNLADSLRQRFMHTRDISDIDQSIIYDQEALTLHPEGDPNKAVSLSDLALGLQTRSEYTGDESDLYLSIRYHQDALDLLTEENFYRARALYNLARGLRARFEKQGERCDLDQSIGCFRDTLPFWPEGHSFRTVALSFLAHGLWVRFEQTEDKIDLDQSIADYQDVLNLLSEEHPDRTMTLSELAIGLWRRFELTGDRCDIDQSITYNQDVLNLLPDEHPDTVATFSNLALALRTRFEHTAHRNDLDKSIAYHQEVLIRWPEGHPERGVALSNLAGGLRIRFEQIGDRSDLSRSIVYLQGAFDILPEGHPTKTTALANLAEVLLTRYKQNENRSDLDHSITYHQDALKLWPDGHPSKAIALSNLARGLRLRFKQTKDRGDLDQSIAYQQDLLDSSPEGHLARAAALIDLALGLGARFEETKDRSDLDQSIAYHQEALNMLPKGHPSRALSLSHLVVDLFEQFELTTDRSNLVSALALAQEGSANELSPVADRLKVSLQWVDIGRLMEDTSVMEAYATSIVLLDRHISLARSIGSRHSRLTNDALSELTADLAPDAASYALEKSLPETAIELLEQGRSILYSQLGNYHTSLTDLEAVDGELARQFRVLSARLEDSTTSAEGQSETDEDTVARYQWVAAKWAEVVERIRGIPGFSSFLKGKTFSELQLAASLGPVIVVNISQYRSDAIVIQYTGSPLVIPLPDASLSQVQSLSERINHIAANPYETPQDLVGLLRETWTIIVEPIAIQLEKTLGLARGSRIFWMPTSRACCLPLHAAGLYVKGKRNMPERFVSSYTPTLSILLHSVTFAGPTGSMSHHVVAPRLLLVCQAIAEGQTRLPGVVKEMKTIQAMFPQAVTLDGESCTREAVLDGLKDAEWVHFACHGHRNEEEPFKSYFALYKEKDQLTLLDIIKHGRPKAELAVLSACHSAEGDKRTPDEAVHMAAGMQFSGFKSVIGTIWASSDEDGALIAEVFYKHMLRNGVDKVDIRDSAAALREATKELRRKKVPLERWINFVHYGA